MALERPMKEQIPDDCFVFRLIHPACLNADGSPQSGVFDDPEMSVEWDKYSTIEHAAKRGGPTHFAAAFHVGFLRTPAFRQVVNHDPLPENQAHSLVLGKKPKASVARVLAKHAMMNGLYRP